MEKTVIINQARMGSTRLPGKILKPVLGRPLLSYQIERLRRVKSADAIIIATTNEPADDEIVKFCAREAITVFRGAENDVLSRYYHAAAAHGATTVVRVTSDCPLIDPATVEQLIQIYHQIKADYDYVSNTLVRSFPRGMDAEVFSMEALQTANLKASGGDREHVTPYIYRHPEEFRFRNVAHEPSLGQHRWTVDTPEDFDLVQRLLKAGLEIRPDFDLNDLVAVIERHPEWSAINAHIEQKAH